jgi:hypothetical protein
MISKLANYRTRVKEPIAWGRSAPRRYTMPDPLDDMGGLACVTAAR